MENGYEYKTVNLNRSNKEFYGFWTQRLPSRAVKVIDKLTKEGWELANTTHDFMGNQRVLNFRRKVAS